MSANRPLRICDVCGTVDDHPRHTFVAQGFAVNDDHLTAVVADESLDGPTRTRLVREIVDTTVQQRHMDCCRDAGCPDGSCNAVLDAGAEGKKGAALVKFLTSGKVDQIGTQVTEINAISQED